MSEVSFSPVFELGLTDKQMPACRQINTAEVNPATLAGMCAAMVDFVVSSLDDSKQIEFEKETLNLFDFIVDNRHPITSKVSNFTVE